MISNFRMLLCCFIIVAVAVQAHRLLLQDYPGPETEDDVDGLVCPDVPPDTTFPCEFQAALGCDLDSLRDPVTGQLVYCLVSCNLCDQVDLANLPMPESIDIVSLLANTPQAYGRLRPSYAYGLAAGSALAMAMPQQYQVLAGSSYSYAYNPTIGFAVGGARGIDNFRSNVEEGYLPLPQDLTYEGIFNDYFFDTQVEERGQTCEQLFCPAYSVGVTPDPIYPQGGNEQYLAVGLDSGLALADFGRKKLNVVVLIDISGSMDSFFDRYAYDGLEEEEDGEEAWQETKMTVANKAVIDMLKHLTEEDHLGIVTFESIAAVLIENRQVKDLNLGQVQETVGSLETTGSTNMEDGYRLATEQIKKCTECIEGGMSKYENRIILLTDAQPNTGDISSATLAGLVQQNSEEDIFTSIIGIGLDFNSELVEILTKTRGANYYSVYSPSQFRTKMDEEFDFMVTPLVFDLKLEIDPASFNDGNGWQVIKVYGSPNIDGGLSEEGTFIEINTLFPSPRTEEGVKGGVVLLKMFKPDANIPLTLRVSYKDRDTLELSESISEVEQFDNLPEEEYFDSTGVQKAILLARYVDLLRGWIVDQREEQEEQDDDYVVIPDIFCSYYPENRFEKLSGSGCFVPFFCGSQGPNSTLF
eukprot:TRINITY_DN5595_c0_g1_i5.p1 TRINITY_DN5595_c0_g1~~TRINITY_DN5595_c0_g1_i5.p1  ORF type:complete len:642 (-),score=87.91 TRINITY_DN5595_c0_g1_i5:882-2807(-)